MDSRPNILILDDDLHLLNSLRLGLEDSYKVYTADRLNKARDWIEQVQLQALILDYKLSEGDGHAFLDDLRNRRIDIPVVVISGCVSLEMSVGFLKRRVFDFYEKPLLLSELRDSLERAVGSDAVKSYSLSDLRVDPAFRKVWFQGQEISLTPTEYRLLDLFLSNPGRQLSRKAIGLHIWNETQISRHTLDTHLLNLKKKLPVLIKRLNVVYGTGYCFEPL